MAGYVELRKVKGLRLIDTLSPREGWRESEERIWASFSWITLPSMEFTTSFSAALWHVLVDPGWGKACACAVKWWGKLSSISEECIHKARLLFLYKPLSFNKDKSWTIYSWIGLIWNRTILQQPTWLKVKAWHVLGKLDFNPRSPTFIMFKKILTLYDMFCLEIRTLKFIFRWT